MIDSNLNSFNINNVNSKHLNSFHTGIDKGKEVAILKIQSSIKGYLIRTELEKIKESSLSPSQTQDVVKAYVNDKTKLQSLPKAGAGKTTVYLSDDFPIVIKVSGISESQKRFEQMRQFRDLTKKLGMQNLVIPKARVHGPFIIEERLPIRLTKLKYEPKEQIAFYLKNKEQPELTETIKEFTRFCCESNVRDITQGMKLFGQTGKMGRYDNIPLYQIIENNKIKYKIGLIDLEHFSLLKGKKSATAIAESLKDVIINFPHHLDAILEIGKEYCDIEPFRQKLIEESKRVASVFKTCEDHASFVQEKNISLDNPCEFQISQNRIEELKQSICEKLVAKHKGEMRDSNWQVSDFLGSDIEATLSQFKTRFPKMMEIIANFIAQKLEEKNEGLSVSSDIELLCLRSLDLSAIEELTEIEEIWSMVDNFTFGEGYKAHSKRMKCIDFIIETIFTEMKGKELAYYCAEDVRFTGCKEVIFC